MTTQDLIRSLLYGVESGCLEALKKLIGHLHSFMKMDRVSQSLLQIHDRIADYGRSLIMPIRELGYRQFNKQMERRRLEKNGEALDLPRINS